MVCRSEMQVGAVSVRFGLILEAYCRGSQQHMRSLFKQMECLGKLKCASDHIKQRKDRKAALQGFQEFIQQPHCQEALSNVLNPLDPSFRWKRIKYVDFLNTMVIEILHMYHTITGVPIM